MCSHCGRVKGGRVDKGFIVKVMGWLPQKLKSMGYPPLIYLFIF